KMSRKPSTFSGWFMPEIRRPAPKIRPQMKLARIVAMSTSQSVADDCDSGDRHDHEDDGCGDRARRKPRKAADTMAGGAATAHAAAEADQEPAGRQQHEARRHRWPGQW